MNTLLSKTALLLAVFTISNAAHSQPVWEPWRDLANHVPVAEDLIKERTKTGATEKKYQMQRITLGSGKAINVDEYVVRIDKTPTNMDLNSFQTYVRKNLNTFLNQNVAIFRPHNQDDQNLWNQASLAPPLGTIMVFEINVLVGIRDTAAVVVSKTGSSGWIFSPIKDSPLGDWGTHPVAGNRQFGFRINADGVLEFFTRAFDRVYTTDAGFGEKQAYEGADSLWRSLQTNLSAYIVTNGGTATVVKPNVPGGNIPLDKPRATKVCAPENNLPLCKAID